MSFTFNDFIHAKVPKLGQRENFSSEIAALNPMSPEDVVAMFPGVKLTEGDSVVYFPLKMCHSLPTVNKRGRCFTAKTLANSFASSVDSLVNREHLVSANNGLIPPGTGDQIIGHIKAATFGDTGFDIASISDAPKTPTPLFALAALYLRAKGVPQMVSEYISGEQKWQTSMECGHSWSEACLLHRGAFIPIAEAPGPMLEGISAGGIRQYDGADVAAVLGGQDGHVDFWGLAFTTAPADEGAELLSVVGGLSRDLASKKIFHIPLHAFSLQGKSASLEVASKVVDKKITELASITIIGETEASDPDHKHMILSDLTIVPTDHDHWLDSKNLSRGTQPTLTGATSVYFTRVASAVLNEYDRNYVEIPHLHLINIPLKGKFAAPEVSTGNTTGDSSSEISNEGDEAMLKDILAELNKLSEVASKRGKDDENFSDFSKDFATAMKEINEVASQDSFGKSVDAEIAKRIEAGTLLTKETADTAVVEAVKEKTEEHEAEKVSAVKRQQRIDKISEAGINLDFELVSAENDGDAVTIGTHLGTIGLDDAGDKEFTIQFSTWVKLVDAAKQQQEATTVVEQTPAREAANKPKKKQSIIATVGGATEQTPAGTSQEIASASPLLGRKLFRN